MKLLVAALLLVGRSKDNANSEGENHQSFVYPKKSGTNLYAKKIMKQGKKWSTIIEKKRKTR
ncbi:hypothetical protein QIU19_12180 [Capnocytophaga canimorsus]|nr:hypothetical protein [Capnocytophaga canimorsus]WGU68080.1 hypothetical protein QIU19_12180 [Capnocytophaga canimorsus]